MLNTKQISSPPPQSNLSTFIRLAKEWSVHALQDAGLDADCVMSFQFQWNLNISHTLFGCAVILKTAMLLGEKKPLETISKPGSIEVSEKLLFTSERPEFQLWFPLTFNQKAVSTWKN